MSTVEFGAYLKALRKVKNLSTYKLSEMAHISQAYVSQVERGLREPPSPEIIRKLSAALGCTHIGMMIKAGHVTEQEVFGFIRESEIQK